MLTAANIPRNKTRFTKASNNLLQKQITHREVKAFPWQSIKLGMILGFNPKSDIRHTRMAELSALLSGRTYSQVISLVPISVRGWEDAAATECEEKWIVHLKISRNLTGNQNRNLPPCDKRTNRDRVTDLFMSPRTQHICTQYIQICGPGSVVGIATAYGLDGPGIESRWDEIFRTCPGRPWGPPSLLYNGYRVFPGAAGAWRWPLTPF